ncbi:hypothetical protein ANO11243_002770 [Dothideomycetidae sp. 11243]|nr:hypothetical protein ANO11243_002770 [fungal sp. No.11243]
MNPEYISWFESSDDSRAIPRAILGQNLDALFEATLEATLGPLVEAILRAAPGATPRRLSDHLEGYLNDHLKSPSRLTLHFKIAGLSEQSAAGSPIWWRAVSQAGRKAAASTL